MRYAVYQKVTFPDLDHLDVPLWRYLDLVLEDCRARLRANGVGTYNASVQIRPWPRDITESSKTGYDRLVPRLGLDIVMTSEPD